MDYTLRAIENQRGIRTLQIGGDTVTGEGMASVAKLTELRELFIWWATGIDDAAVAHIGRLPRLRVVDISLLALYRRSDGPTGPAHALLGKWHARRANAQYRKRGQSPARNSAMKEHPESDRRPWLQGLAAAGWTFSVIMGTAGLGLVGGLAYGAWVASQTPRITQPDDFFVSIAWVVCLVLYGVIGFVGGLAAGLLVMLMKWIVRLAKRIVRSWEENRTTPE